MTIVYLILAVLGVLMVLPQVISHVLETVGKLSTSSKKTSAECFRTTHALMTHGGLLEPHEVASIAGGSTLLFLLLLGLLMMGYHLFVPTLGPLFGVPTGELAASGLGSLAHAFIAAAILVPVVCGIIISDLVGWTSMTCIANCQRGRHALFWIATTVLVWSLLLGLAAGAYRAVIGLEPVLGSLTVDTMTGYISGFIVLSADALVLASIFLASISLESVIRTVLALHCAVLAIAALLLNFAMELLRATLKPVEQCITAFSSSSAKHLRGFAQRTNGKISKLVAPVERMPLGKSQVDGMEQNSTTH